MTTSTPHSAPPGRLQALARGVLALLVLAVALVAIPVTLALVAGNPLPSHVPTLEQVRAVFAAPASDDTLVLAAVRDAAWLVWLAFTTSTLIEVAARTRGRAVPHLPALGTLQLASAKLITTITLMTSAPSAAALAAATTPIAATAPAVPVADSTPVNAHPGQHPHAHTYTVKPHDTLWSIAAQHLGDGHRYHEIQALNPHVKDPRLLMPGTRLHLPGHSSTRAGHPATRHQPHRGQPPRPATPPTTPPAASPRPHPTMPEPSPTQASPAPPLTQPSMQPTAAETPLTPQPTATQPGNPPTSTPAAPSPEASSPAPGVHAAGSAHQDSAAPQMLSVFGVGMLAGGVLTKLAQMRSRQRQYRRRGRRIRLPVPARPHRTEKRLVHQADPRTGRLLRTALRALPDGLAAAGIPAPVIIGVHLVDGKLELLLAEPAPVAPAPWSVVASRRDMCWELTDTSTLPAGPLDDDARQDPLPGLVTAGRTETGGYLLVNAEALGVIGCTGPRALVERTLATLAIEAASNPWAGWYDAILVGFNDLEATEGRVHTCDDLDEAITLVGWRADRIRAHLDKPGSSPDSDDHAAGDVRDQRLLGSSNDDLALTLLISSQPASADQMTRLVAAVDGTGGLAAILPVPPSADVPARFTLLGDTDTTTPRMRIDPLQITVHPHPLSSDDYHDIIELFTSAADLDDVDPSEPPYLPHDPKWPAVAADHFPIQPFPPDELVEDIPNEELPEAPARWGAASSPSAPAVPMHDADTSVPHQNGPLPQPSRPESPSPASASAGRGLRIGVLGPLEVAGTDKKLQPKQVELVLLLALQGDVGLRNEQLRTLLGPDPDQPKRADSFRQTISRTRRALGDAADGTARIEHVGDGIYRLRDASVDWDEFQNLVDQAADLGPAGARHLMRALELVRGKPLEGCYWWWIDTPLIESMRATVVDAAELLAEYQLATGDAAGAGRAARKGLTSDPSAEQLWRMVMRAEHLAGNTAGVHEAWTNFLKELAAVDPDLEPHPDTIAIYHQFTGRSPAPARTR